MPQPIESSPTPPPSAAWAPARSSRHANEQALARAYRHRSEVLWTTMLSTRAAESILRAVAPRAGDLQEDAVQRLAHHEAQYELTRIALSWVRKEVLEPEHRQACEAAALAVQAAR